MKKEPDFIRGGRIRVLCPDGSYKTVRVPNAGPVRLGHKTSILLTWRERVFVFWLVRVKGGWLPWHDATVKGAGA